MYSVYSVTPIHPYIPLYTLHAYTLYTLHPYIPPYTLHLHPYTPSTPYIGIGHLALLHPSLHRYRLSGMRGVQQTNLMSDSGSCSRMISCYHNLKGGWGEGEGERNE